MLTIADLRQRMGREQKLLLLFVALAALGWAFAALAIDMTEGETATFDQMVTVMFRVPSDLSQAIGPAWLTSAMIDLTALGSVAVLTLVSVLAVAFLLFRGRQRLAVMMAGATLGGAVLSVVLKDLFARPRPTIVPHLVDVNTLSFPSGHAINSAIVYLTIALVMARNFEDRATRVFILASATVLVFVIGVTRVFLGVHYPSDVLAGWMVGSAWALAMGALARELQHEHKVEPPEAPAHQPLVTDTDTGTYTDTGTETAD